jgi:hypothetical protein
LFCPPIVTKQDPTPERRVLSLIKALDHLGYDSVYAGLLILSVPVKFSVQLHKQIPFDTFLLVINVYEKLSLFAWR